MYLAEAEEIFDYWRENPPTYQITAVIARMLGWEPAAKVEPLDESLFLLAPDEADAIGRAAGLPAPVVSLDAMRERNLQKMVEIARRNTAALKGPQPAEA